MKNGLSGTAIGLVMLVVIGWTLVRKEHFHREFSWDAFGYYLYLPAIFIYDDMAIKDPSWFDELFSLYSPSGTVYQIDQTDHGGRVIKYPIGLSILWTPFFFLGHWIAGLLGHPQDGMSDPYDLAMLLASWSYLALGLVWLRSILLQFFNDHVAAITMILIVLGTNFLHLLVFSPLMPHAFLFTIYAGIIWYSIKWHGAPNMRDSAILGLLLGLAISVRNTEVIAMVIPVLWGVWDHPLSKQFKKFRDHWHMVLVVLVALFLVCIPQLYYWKVVTGGFFYMGYTNAGEGLDLLRPHVWNVLFSFRKGLLIYTPLVIVAAVGLFLMCRYVRSACAVIPVYLVINFWIVSSWSVWWYADSFGNRAFIQSFAALAIPLACLVQWSNERKTAMRYSLVCITVIIVGLSIFQSWQTSVGILHTSRMTQEAYLMTFGSTQRPAGLEEALLFQRPYDGIVLAPDPSRYASISVEEQTFDDRPPDPEDPFIDPLSRSGTASYRLDKDNSWSHAMGRRYRELTSRDHVYAHYTTHLFIPEGSAHPDVVMAVELEHDGRRYGGLVHHVAQEELIPGQWNEISMWYVTPTVRHPDDLMRAFLWLKDTTPVWVDDARLEVFGPVDR